MTFAELLQNSVNGLPKVICNGEVGQVTTIKDSGAFKGCAVRFNKNYDDWFWDIDETDKRRRYMRDLKLA